MRLIHGTSLHFLLLSLVFVGSISAQEPKKAPAAPAHDAKKAPAIPVTTKYVLGPGDQVKIWALGMEEISDKTLQVDPGGNIDVPLVGQVKAGGMTLDQLRSDLVKKLAADVREPMVSIDIVQFGSQPVSVIGAVGAPGVHQLRGGMTLAEVLSLAGGLRADAGPKVKITRRIEAGELPLANAKVDASGEFSVGEVKLRDFMSATTPKDNIVIRPRDVITVPTTELVYVIGAVRKAGGFPLNERESLSVLQALSLAEGLGPVSSPANSKILRMNPNSAERTEIPVNLKKTLSGEAKDFALQPNDILFVPDSTSKKAAAKVLDTTLQTLSGVVIWRRPY